MILGTIDAPWRPLDVVNRQREYGAMTSIAEAAEELRDSASRLPPRKYPPLRGSFRSATVAERSALKEKLAITRAIEEWYVAASPVRLRFRWMSGEIDVFGIDDILESQRGYAWNALSGKPLDWPSSWIVIASVDGDPFIADVSDERTPVLVAHHGCGSWKPTPVADDLGAFLGVLAAWVRVALGEFDGEFFTNDSEIRADLIRTLQREWAVKLSSRCLGNLMGYLLS